MPVWTPPNSSGTLGSIQLPSPRPQSLTPEMYRDRLAARINRLVSAEEPGTARRLLRAMEEPDGLMVPEDLSTVGALMVEASNWLRDRAGMPSDPVPAARLKPQLETGAALASETLEEFLMELYLTRS
jgi:hypothetical protein